MSKKKLSIIICCFAAAALSACADTSDTVATNDTEASVEAETTVDEDLDETSEEITEEEDLSSDEEISVEDAEESEDEQDAYPDVTVEVSSDDYEYILVGEDYKNGKTVYINEFGFNLDDNTYGLSPASYYLDEEGNEYAYYMLFYSNFHSTLTVGNASDDISMDLQYYNGIILDDLHSFLNTSTIPQTDYNGDNIVDMQIKETIDTKFGSAPIIYLATEPSGSSTSCSGKEIAIFHANGDEFIVIYTYPSSDAVPEYQGFLMDLLPEMFD
jgi:hypothetical protein